MNIFEERYFNFNRRAFVYMGLWPFDEKSPSRKYVTATIMFLLSIPHLLSIVINHKDIDRAILNTVISFIAILMFLKVLALILAEDKMIHLYRNIAENWQSITNAEEKKILLEYSEVGRKKSIYYFAFIEGGICSLYALPICPKIMDMVNPLPDQSPRPNIHILEGELFIDQEKHYLLIYLWDVISVVINATVCVCIDTMYIVCLEHCCALYAIIKYRLSNLGSSKIDSSIETKVDSYYAMTEIIKLHEIALDFTTTANEAFSKLFLFILISYTGAVPLDALTVISNLDKPFNLIRFAILFVMFQIHLFMLFLPGQNVLDQSIELTDYAHYNEWYATPVRTRKMLVTFMIRCTQPSLLDAGGLMLMNFETFAKIMKTCISYITVAVSLR